MILALPPLLLPPLLPLSLLLHVNRGMCPCPTALPLPLPPLPLPLLLHVNRGMSSPPQIVTLSNGAATLVGVRGRYISFRPTSDFGASSDCGDRAAESSCR